MYAYTLLAKPRDKMTEYTQITSAMIAIIAAEPAERRLSFASFAYRALLKSSMPKSCILVSNSHLLFMAFKHLHEHIFKALVATNFVDIAVGYQLAALYDSYLVAEFFGYIQNVGR